MWLEGWSQWKNPLTLSGIETAASRFVAQWFNHLHYRVPHMWCPQDTCTTLQPNAFLSCQVLLLVDLSSCNFRQLLCTNVTARSINFLLIIASVTNDGLNLGRVIIYATGNLSWFSAIQVNTGIITRNVLQCLFLLRLADVTMQRIYFLIIFKNLFPGRQNRYYIHLQKLIVWNRTKRFLKREWCFKGIITILF